MTPSATTSKQDDEDQAISPWCIFVKAVGGGFDDKFRTSADNDDDDDDENGKQIAAVGGPRSFNVSVSPEDGMDSLHKEIEGVTGVKSSQQRLIYRGRLIGKSDVSPSSSLIDANINNINNNQNNNDNSKKTSVCCQHEEYKIKDIVGLCDGQTIHLVKKRRETTENNVEVDVADEQDTTSGLSLSDSNNTTTNFSSAGAGNISSTTDNEGSHSSGSGGALLAALLGLGSLDSGINTSNTIDRSATPTAAAAATAAPTISPWRASRTGTSTSGSSGLFSHRHNRRLPYRLVAADLVVQDPGSLEPVRQGLMTLHTIMNSQQNVHVGEGGGIRSHPFEANREFFRGQWIDVRDTVNQWLEATVVDVLDPQDILNDVVLRNQPTTTSASAAASIGSPLYRSSERQQRRRARRVSNVDNDPVIGATDLEGRRRLFLEECEPGDPQELLSDSSNVGRGDESFRPRSNNDGVKLLLIHYNGWPERWDEYMRSDSERIRPFRTRTRHPNMSSIASPTPQSVFTEAPRTNIQDGDEEDDRLALLPELNVALAQVSELLGELVHREHDENNNNQNRDEDELEDLRPSSRQRQTTNDTCGRAKKDLPWMAQGGVNDVENSTKTDKSDDDDDRACSTVRCNIVDPEEEDESENMYYDDEDAISERVSGRDSRSMYSQRELRNLATVFDRLGRILTTSASHVASLAASLPEEINTPSDQSASNSSERINPPELDTSLAPLGGLLSLWSRERRRHNGNQENASTRSETLTATIDPDHVDFASGVVNTSRGEVRQGPRSRTSHDDVATLLGTYLAAANLGSGTDDNGSGNSTGLARLLSRGSNGGSGDTGIDIHIHAIVTAPGASPGGMGIATIGSGGRSPTTILGGARNLFSSNRGSARSGGGGGALRGNFLSSTNTDPMDEEDYADLFSELYSENPRPIDPNGSLVQESPQTTATGNQETENDEDNNAGSNNSQTQTNQSQGNNSGIGDQRQGQNRNSSPRQSVERERRSGVLRRIFRRRESSRD
ncbi:MAG: hypothetical protein ACI8RD_001342 [Bacillariaceae sp.]|jgi:hypothetical protein